MNEDVEVPSTVSIIESNSLTMWVIRPEAPLSPHTTYEVKNCSYDTWEFSTSAVEDTLVPSLPSDGITNAVASYDEDWGSSIYVEFPAIDPNSLLLVDVNGQTNLDAETIDGEVQAMVGAPSPRPMLGYALCDGNYSAKLGESVDVRLGVFNLAGKFSGWTSTKTITFPEDYLDGDGPRGEPDEPDDPQDPEMPDDPDSPDADQGKPTEVRTSGCSWSIGGSGASGTIFLLLGFLALLRPVLRCSDSMPRRSPRPHRLD